MNLCHSVDDIDGSKPTIFVDFHVTLSLKNYWDHLQLPTYRVIDIALFRHSPTIVDEWMHGKISAEEVTAYVAGKTGLDRQELLDSLITGCIDTTYLAGLALAVSALRNHAQTVLFTDNTDCLHRFVLPGSHLSSAFDHIASSWVMQARKLQILEELAQRWPRAPFLFVDDSQEVISRCGELGYTGIQTASPGETLRILQYLPDQPLFGEVDRLILSA